jgi:formiminoglutamase
MTWKTHYLSPDPTQWRGRTDIPARSCFFQIVNMLDLLDFNPFPIHQTPFAFVGFRCDEGIRRNGGRIGAAEGPSAIRQSLAKLPILKQNIQCFDAGSIVCLEGDLEASQAALGEVVALLLSHNISPIVLGGGHELAWGHYQGIYKAFPDKHLGIINFDSHFDMRPLLPNNKGSSGTPFLQIAEAHKVTNNRFDYNCIGIQHAGNIRQLIDTAKSYNTKVIWADELYLNQLDKCVDFIDRVIDQNEIIYLSLCLDVFSSAYAPGVSAIQPLGLHPWHIIPLIRQLAASGKVICYDIAEMSPRYDIDHSTAKLAAHLVYEFIHHHNESPRLW